VVSRLKSELVVASDHLKTYHDSCHVSCIDPNYRCFGRQMTVLKRLNTCCNGYYFYLGELNQISTASPPMPTSVPICDNRMSISF
jgi:hypothetical protein